MDGKPAQIVLIGDAMIGVQLTEGEHQVSFSYHNAAFALGWKISLACAAAFLALIQINYKPDWKSLLKRKPGKFQK